MFALLFLQDNAASKLDTLQGISYFFQKFGLFSIVPTVLIAALAMYGIFRRIYFMVKEKIAEARSIKY